MLELINPLSQVALRLPDRVANYQPGVPLPARFVSQEELLRIREEVLASSCHLSPDVWSSDLTGKGQRVLVLQYIGGSLQSALSGPSFKELYPLYLSALQSGKSQFESHRIALDLLAAKEQTRSQGGSAIFKEEAAAASPRPAITATATATKSAPCLPNSRQKAAISKRTIADRCHNPYMHACSGSDQMRIAEDAGTSCRSYVQHHCAPPSKVPDDEQLSWCHKLMSTMPVLSTLTSTTTAPV